MIRLRAFAALALFSATAGTTVAASTLPPTDDTQPQRVISLSASITEWLFAIGAGDQVVAVDSYSNFPPAAPTTELSGFQPNVEALSAYDPDLVLLSSNRDGIAEALTAAGIPNIVVTTPPDVAGLRSNVLAIGTAVGRQDEAAAAVAEFDRDLAAAASRSAPEPIETRNENGTGAEPNETATSATTATSGAGTAAGISFYWELGDAFHTVTSATLIGDLVAPLGMVSIADGVDPAAGAYPQLSAEAVLATDPDLIVIAWASGTSPTADEVASRPGWSTLTAATQERIVVLDSDVATRWGPRVVELVATVAAARP